MKLNILNPQQVQEAINGMTMLEVQQMEARVGRLPDPCTLPQMVMWMANVSAYLARVQIHRKAASN